MTVARSPLQAIPQLDFVLRLAALFHSKGHGLFLVGGSVRDALVGRPVRDLDFATDAAPRAVERLIRQAGASGISLIGEKFGTVGGLVDGTHLEITTFRAESYQPRSRKPMVTFQHSLEADLARRDFTINAVAVELPDGDLSDPFHGQTDLARGVIRAVGSPSERFVEDPLRLLRAVRLATELDFQVEPVTWRAIVERASSLAGISRERVAQEMNKILLATNVAVGLRMLCDSGLIAYIVPEILEMRGMRQDGYQHKDVFEHTLMVVAGVPPILALRWGALLHDVGKPRTRTVESGQVRFHGHERVGEHLTKRILGDLRYDRNTIGHVALLVAMHQRANSYDSTWTDGAVRRFMREAGEYLESLLDLSRADVTSRRPERRRAAARRVQSLDERIAAIRAREDVARLQSPLDGNELMALFGRGPGPWIKPIKERLLGMVLDGDLDPEDNDKAAQIAREMLAASGEGQIT